MHYPKGKKQAQILLQNKVAKFITSSIYNKFISNRLKDCFNKYDLKTHPNMN